MKKSVIKLSVLTLAFTAVLLSSCGTSAKRSAAAKSNDNAEKKSEVKKDLEEVKSDYKEKYEDFKNVFDGKVKDNEKAISNLKSEAKSKSKSVQADIEKKIKVLEKKNQNLKDKFSGYKDEGEEKWESFKHGMNRDMDRLGKGIRDLMENKN
ncbi:MAG: hypothetical protein SGJ00_06350 [bacterium]|nr:hypothetical protein [bacterium]